MENMDKISAVIITYNEAKNIARCIESLLNVADEIVIVDSFSTDETPAICRKYPVKFHQTDWKGYAATKNYANSLAEYDYILSVDADEAPDETLQKNILLAKQNGLSGAYSVNRLTNYCGKWIRHSGWYPDVKTRLFNKINACWEGAFVHEELKFKTAVPSVVQLDGHLLHYSYYDFEDHQKRADKYSILTAQKLHHNGVRVSVIKPYLSGLGRFIAMYILKSGWRDGYMGWKIASISAKSNILKYKELIRLNRAKEN